MTTTEIQPDLLTGKIGDLLKDVSKLEISDFQKFARHFQFLMRQRLSVAANGQETVLLAQIKQDLLPPSQRNHLKRLQRKLSDHTLTEEERKTLLDMNRTLETNGAKRLESLLQLAKLRGISFDEILSQLGMKTPFPENA